MADWLDEEELCDVALFLVIDNEVSLARVTDALRFRVPLLVPAGNTELRNLCLTAGCGLVYHDHKSAMEALQTMFNAPSVRHDLGAKGFQFLFSP
jgi:hypothetical protein